MLLSSANRHSLHSFMGALGLAGLALLAACSDAGGSTSTHGGGGGGSTTGSGGTGGSGGDGGTGGSGGIGGNGGNGGNGGGGPACTDFTGTFVVTEAIPCSAIGQLLKGSCVTQNGCALTVATNVGVLTGTVDGDTATLSGDLFAISTAIPYECTAKLENGSLALACSYMVGGSSGDCTMALPKQALPAGATSACCDVLGQSCGAGSKCTLGDPAEQLTTNFSLCEAAGGAVAKGAACTRNASGEDDCAPGLLCTDEAKAANSGACREFCAKASDCGASELCLAYIYTSPLTGLCVPTCTPFGNDCEAGSTCRGRTVLDNEGLVDYSGNGFACGHTGALAVGELCTQQWDCGANARCGIDQFGDKRCVSYCDDAHPCNGGQFCSTYGIPSYPTFGECQ